MTRRDGATPVQFPWRIAGFIAVILLAAASWSSAKHLRAGPNFQTCHAQGPAAAGTVIPVHREARVVGPGAPGEVLVRERGLDETLVMRVTGITEPAPPGTSISVKGRFDPPDRVHALVYHLHHGRFAKVWISLPPLFWLVWILARRWRLGPQGLEERP